MERTLAIIKPDVIQKKKVGEVISMIEKKFDIIAMKMVKISKDEAIEFYIEHKGKDFFDKLIEFITSGPIIPMVIQGENVIKEFRNFVGDTDPQKAKEGTIRKIFGENLPRNAIHASDSKTSAIREIRFFFDAI